MATELGAAAAIDTGATIAALVPAFGLIGQDFVAATIVAQANHVRGVGELAAVHAATAAAAVAGLTGFTAQDAASSATIRTRR
ncbi:hypothetical protein [Gordonia sp. CPCC 206044]|uniref:hypothetical protein n=1 Tax=Gordonia sp. CPCC 206044 TaxID=3140793 RepID=UPI003AF3A3F3